MVVESARPFAGFVEADGELAVGQPGEDAAAHEALQIDDPVEVLQPQPPHAAPDFVPVTRYGPTTALKPDHARQVWVAFQ